MSRNHGNTVVWSAAFIICAIKYKNVKETYMLQCVGTTFICYMNYYASEA